MHYFSGLFYHLPLLLGVGVIKEDIYLRQHVEGYLVRVNMGDSGLPVQYLSYLGRQFFNGG